MKSVKMRQLMVVPVYRQFSSQMRHEVWAKLWINLERPVEGQIWHQLYIPTWQQLLSLIREASK